MKNCKKCGEGPLKEEQADNLEDSLCCECDADAQADAMFADEGYDYERDEDDPRFI